MECKNPMRYVIVCVIKGLKKATFEVKGYNHFDDRVVYMDVNMSHEGKEIHDRIIDGLSTVPYIEFTESDGKDKVFHINLASKKIRIMFDNIWDYVNQYDCNISTTFDNVCIYKWNINTSELSKEFKI